MESSSEDNFEWTDASCNDSVDSDVMDGNNKAKEQSDNESEYGKSYKKKLQKELFAHKEDNNESSIQQKGKKRKANNEKFEDDIESPRKKKIKSEPESDIEIHRKKKISKYHDGHGLDIISKNSFSNDESYLNLRVKEELAFKVPSPSTSKKKKKRKEEVNGDTELSDLSTDFPSRSDDTSCNHNDDIDQKTNYEEIQRKEKKKKKKKIKRSKDISEEESEIDFVNIKDKFSAEETVVETRHVNNNNEYTTSSEQVTVIENDLHNINGRWNSDNGNIEKAEKHNKIKTRTSESKVISNEEELPVRMDEQRSRDSSADHTDTSQNHDRPEKTNPRISRLSDRFRFEDEDSIDIYKNDNNTSVGATSKKWEDFLKVHENLKTIPGKLKNESVLTQADEIWILRCPRDINVNAFQDIIIPLDKKCKIKVEDSSYECSARARSGNVAVLSQAEGTLAIKNISSNGIIHLRKRVPKVHIQDDSVMSNNQTDFIPLPETKVRHPLFGPNYKKAVKIPAAVRERLQQANRVAAAPRAHVPTEHKQRSNKANREELLFNTETKPEPESLEELPPKKTSKKRKHKGSEGEMFLKKTKRQKFETNSSEVWDSEKAIEENLFNF